MTVREFYEETGGDYNDIMARLKTEDRIIKFAGMFARDESFKTLVTALDEQNVDDAFRAAHTMKGMCQNMAFKRLFASSQEITELLRVRNLEKAKEVLGKVAEDYNLIIEGIHKLTVALD